MSNSSSRFNPAWLTIPLIVAGFGAAFWNPWAAAPLLLLACGLIAFGRHSAGSASTSEIDAVLKKVGEGELVSRLPRAFADPMQEAIRVNLNSALDQTETTFREILGGMSGISDQRNWRRLQTTGVHGTFKQVLEQAQTLLDQVNAAQESIALEALLSRIFLRSERGLSMAISNVNERLETVGRHAQVSAELSETFAISASGMSEASERMSTALGQAQVSAESGTQALGALSAKASAIALKNPCFTIISTPSFAYPHSPFCRNGGRAACAVPPRHGRVAAVPDRARITQERATRPSFPG